MAGRVPAHIMLSTASRSWYLEPSVCPGADEHRADAGAADPGLAPRCAMYYPLIGRRSCIYLYGTARDDNVTNRVDIGMLAQEAEVDGKLQARCSVLCLVARRNRPPGV